MKFASPLIHGVLLQRYQRFLADVCLDSGVAITAHVANTGSMKGCAEPGSEVWLSHHPGGTRKFPHSLELVSAGEAWIAVNTALPNRIVEDAIRGGRVPELEGYDRIVREVPYGAGSRIDLLLSRAQGSSLCYVEVKNVTLRLGAVAAFPDAVTKRGLKHLLELREVAAQGHRAVMFYLVNRTDCRAMRPAFEIDREYSETLLRVLDQGVEAIVYRATISTEGIEVAERVPFLHSD